jgi:CDGSH-type Zn-finger protein
MPSSSESDPRDRVEVPDPAPRRPTGGPVPIEESAGFYAWCRCLRSHHVPYCDGSHNATGLLPLIVFLEQPQLVRWCGCGRTSTPPRCDDRGCARHGETPS